MTPAPYIDSSVLAAGTCAGSVHLLRYSLKLTSPKQLLIMHKLRYHGHQPVPIEVVETIEVSDKRIIHLSWSAWRTNTPKQGSFHALLSYTFA